MTTDFILLVLGIFIAGFFALWFLLRARIRRFLRIENLMSQTRVEARALISELNEAANRNINLVEDRIKILQDLLRRIEKSLHIKAKEDANFKKEQEVYSKLGMQISNPRKSSEKNIIIDLPLYPRETTLHTVDKLGKENKDSSPAIASSTNQSIGERVIEMHRQGFSTKYIAQMLNMGLAEIELYIAMQEGK